MDVDGVERWRQAVQVACATVGDESSDVPYSAEDAAKPVPSPECAPDIVHGALPKSAQNRHPSDSQHRNKKRSSHAVFKSSNSDRVGAFGESHNSGNDTLHSEYNVTPLSTTTMSTPLRKTVKKPPALRYIVTKPDTSSAESAGGGSGAIGSTLLSVRMNPDSSDATHTTTVITSDFIDFGEKDASDTPIRIRIDSPQRPVKLSLKPLSKNRAELESENCKRGNARRKRTSDAAGVSNDDDTATENSADTSHPSYSETSPSALRVAPRLAITLNRRSDGSTRDSRTDMHYSGHHDVLHSKEVRSTARAPGRDGRIRRRNRALDNGTYDVRFSDNESDDWTPVRKRAAHDSDEEYEVRTHGHDDDVISGSESDSSAARTLRSKPKKRKVGHTAKQRQHSGLDEDKDDVDWTPRQYAPAIAPKPRPSSAPVQAAPARQNVLQIGTANALGTRATHKTTPVGSARRSRTHDPVGAKKRLKALLRKKRR
eukprot:m.1312827 g.1312827  ORF g.1312827 m.1312827 type:complete len:485 (+) comp24830_c0_seq22:245-1699(+)